MLTAIFTAGAIGGIHAPAAIELIDIGGVVAALLLITMSYILLRKGQIPWPIALVVLLAAMGEVAENIDSINLMVIAVSRALLILFLALLSQA